MYTTYIHATPEQVWHALTDPELTVGSSVDHVRADGSGVCDAAGTVVEADRPRRLAFTFDDPGRAGDPAFAASMVTFEIDADRDIVRLTVTHTRLRTAADRRAIGQGWPAVLANLKTLLETGDILPQPPWEFPRAARAADEPAPA